MLMRALVLAGAAGLAVPAPVGAQGGPDRVIEQYRAWTVTCESVAATGAATATETCVMEQSVTDSASGATVMRLTIAAGSDRPVPVGTIIGPFGVDLAQGLTLSVDGAEAWQIAFLTCLQIGCVANLVLDEAEVAALRAGTTLVAMIRPSDNPTSEISLSFALDGFGDALARLQGGAGTAP
jgi:invasion protein IalB